MPPQSSRKRRVDDDEDDVPPPTQSQRHQRRMPSPAADDDDEDDVDIDVELGEEQDNSSGSIAQLSKSLVRYALSCEYARIPIKRQDISQKVLGTHTREFRKVFDIANGQLLDVFGMTMVELPNKEKVTVRQKRAAIASESQSKTSNQWVLRNALPDQFRSPDIITPPGAPTAEIESAYVGLYTMAITLISLNGGKLSQGQLDRYLRRMNANQTTPVDATDKVIVRMVKEGYLNKIKDSSSGEEIVDYMVGPRGKVEVDKEAMAKFVKLMYSVGPQVEDLDARLNRSLALDERNASE